jgi:hypothetical protein
MVGMDEYCISFLWAKRLIEKDEAFFLQDCLREGGIPECFGLCGIKDVCVSNRLVRGYRLCRICEKVVERSVIRRRQCERCCG